MIGIVIATEPPFPPKQLGKIVPHEGGLAYVFDGVKPFFAVRAFGVAETVLVEMLRSDIRRIYYTYDGLTYAATRDQVLADGFRAAPGQRVGYLYLPLKAWKQVERPSFQWVPANQRITMVWRVDATELTDWRARLLAARPARPVQMGLWA